MITLLEKNVTIKVDYFTYETVKSVGATRYARTTVGTVGGVILSFTPAGFAKFVSDFCGVDESFTDLKTGLMHSTLEFDAATLSTSSDVDYIAPCAPVSYFDAVSDAQGLLQTGEVETLAEAISLISPFHVNHYIKWENAKAKADLEKCSPYAK
jgi:hypothetical protein